MTREEAITAITRLKNIAWLYGSVEREQNIEALDMAIEALKERAMTRDEARQELAEWITKMKDHGVPPYSTKYKALKLAIEALQAEPVKHGEWENHGNEWLTCSLCDWESAFNYNYCPNCGAKMRGEE